MAYARVRAETQMGQENGDINKDRELDMRIGMYAALDVLEPEDVEAFLSRIPEETWSEDRLENMVSDFGR